LAGLKVWAPRTCLGVVDVDVLSSEFAEDFPSFSGVSHLKSFILKTVGPQINGCPASSW
jgi:hypothetical protein